MRKRKHHDPPKVWCGRCNQVITIGEQATMADVGVWDQRTPMHASCLVAAEAEARRHLEIIRDGAGRTP